MKRLTPMSLRGVHDAIGGDVFTYLQPEGNMGLLRSQLCGQDQPSNAGNESIYPNRISLYRSTIMRNATMGTA
jgi:hypothetical protein